MTVDLSAIVVTRNEQAQIGVCIEACLRAIRRAQGEGLIRTAEAILADSASTDRTVEIAQRFPVTIVQLGADWPLSAAAGRFVGLRHANGEMILFVDGDYVLHEEWLPVAIRTLRSEASVAAVCGIDVEETKGDTILERRQRDWLNALRGAPEAVPIGLFRRGAIDSVGGIHPFLKGGEDRDLAQRLRAAGHHLVRIDRPMGVHRWAEGGRMDYFTYFRSVMTWSLGDGQAFRARRGSAAIDTETRRRYANVRFLQSYLLSIVLFVLLGINLLSAVLLPWIAIFTDGVTVASLWAVRRRKGWSWKELAFQFHVVPYVVVRHGGFLAGFLRRIPNPSDYPSGETVLKTGEIFGGT